MNKVDLNSNDIIIADIVTKQEYTQNRIKYETKYIIKELYNKIFLINKENKSKILFTSYLFNIKELLGLKDGVIIIADYQIGKSVFLFGTLDNPLDNKSLLKVEFLRDKYYDDNILTFANWLNFFANKSKSTFVITNSQKKFKELIQNQNLNDYKFKFISTEDIEKLNKTVKPVFIKKDMFTIYAPSIIVFFLLYFFINIVGNNIIKADIKNSEEEKKSKTQELSIATQSLQKLKDSDYYKNKDYYMKLSERKIYEKAK